MRDTITIVTNGHTGTVPLTKVVQTKAEVFASLGHMLTYAKSEHDIARIILQAADELFQWTEATFDLFSTETQHVKTIIRFEKSDGSIREVESNSEWRSPSADIRKSITDGPLRRSSGMITPIVNGKVRGVISIQSDRVKEFSVEDLVTLNDLAVHCAGAIERVQTEVELASAEAKMRAIIENNSDLITLLDHEGNIVFDSPSVTDMLGYRHGELIGTSGFALLHPEDLPEARRLFGELLKNADGTEKMLLRFRSRQGEWKWFDCRGSNKLGNHAIKAIIVNARDVTDAKRLEEDILRSARQYKMMFDNNPMPIIACETESQRILGVNSSAVTKYGFSEEEFTRLTLNDIDITAEAVFPPRVIKLHHDGERRVGLKHRNKQGKVIDVEITSHPIEYNGRPARLLMIVDVTEKVQFEEQMLKSQKMESIGTLSGGIAHDFNNILSIVLAHTSNLIAHATEKEKLAGHVSAIQTAVQRGAGIVRQLLTFARKNDLTIEPLAINEQIREMIAMFSETFPRHIDISADLEECIPPIVADTTQIQQMFLNLAVNARDAMPNGGKLMFKTETVTGEEIRKRFPNADARRYIRITVSDTGTGMNEETRSHMFEPFFTTKGIGKGTGLGLSVVYGVVMKQQGFIDVDSVPGKGTSFLIALPLSDKEVAEREVEQTAVPESLNGNETILLVEDEAMISDLVQYMLEEKGYRVLTARDGQEGLQKFLLNADSIHLVISDIGLPKMSGNQMFVQIKEHHPEAIVILASGYIEPELKEMLLKEGAADFVYKPYNAEELLTSIRKNLDKRLNTHCLSS